MSRGPLRAAVAAALALVVLPASAVADTTPAPGSGVPATEEARAAAVRCDPALAARPRPPVVLVHGTGVDAEINWSWGYAKDLRERGHGICLFDLPRAGAVDLQDSVLLTVAAIRKAHAEGGARRISVIGHSQGAAQLVTALRLWPEELGPMVEDLVGLAGAYDPGSASIADGCARGCVPAFHQFATGSRFLAALAERPLPPGVDATAIGTLEDTVVTPQPAANALPGARTVQIQDVCPGRRLGGGLDHIYMAADAVAHALAIDALGRPGPADPGAVPATTCLLQTFASADLVGLAALSPRLLAALGADRSADAVPDEPALRCPLDAARCVTTARRVSAARVRPGARVRVRVGVDERVAVRLVGGGRGGAARVLPAGGRATLALPAPRRAGLRRYAVEARPATGGTWRRAATVRVRVVAPR